MLQSQNLRILCLLAAISSMAVMVVGICDSCQTNNVACLNETHYRMCSANVAPNQILKCGENKVCTEYAAICMDKDAVPAACPADGANGSCETCNGNNLFVCTSRTTFQMCDGTTLTDQVTYCKDNKICSISSGKYCVDSCEITGSVECDRVAP
ncbi:uncharacterized protein LOC110190302 [Drosophila serrata]|uniref:uncharacterized protein LOC110190302 n=1 Tax=Drosophila serrata TaxID=7274 RepID=UPI000A1D043D|nr:uncharacterized protein LOC110190302 [Drosophila serrata]